MNLSSAIKASLLFLTAMLSQVGLGAHLVIMPYQKTSQYTVRWGVTDTLSADLLSTPFPACFNQGLADGSSRIAVNLVLDPGDSPNTQWQVFPGGLYSHAYTYNSLMRELHTSFQSPYLHVWIGVS